MFVCGYVAMNMCGRGKMKTRYWNDLKLGTLVVLNYLDAC